MSKEDRKISPKDIQEVQNLIERCLQHYLSKSEVVRVLEQENIDPTLTQLVWQNLEAENKEFFRAYYLRLMLKDQIQQFNQLLDKQVELTRNITPNGVVTIPMPNAPHILSMHEAPFRAPNPCAPYMNAQSMHQMLGFIPNVHANSVSPAQPNMLVNMPGHSGRVDVPSNILLGRSSNAGMMNGFNGVAINSKGKNVVETPVMFPANNNLRQPFNGIGGTSISPFRNAEPSRQAFLHEPLNPRVNSFGFLGQMNQNIRSPGLTADCPNRSTAVVEKNSRSPVVRIGAGLLESRNREQQPNKRLDNRPQGFNDKHFGSS